MRGPASPGDDGLEAATDSAFGVGKHVVGHAVRREHPRLVGNAELLENVDCVLHGVPVGTRTHDDADLNIFHGDGTGPADALRLVDCDLSRK